MRQHVVRVASLIGLLSLMVALGAVAWQGGAPSAATGSGTTGVWVKLDGEKRNASVGDVLKVVSRQVDGKCDNGPSYEVGLEANVKSVELYLDPDTCRLVLSEVAKVDLSPNPAITPTPTTTASAGRAGFASPVWQSGLSHYEVRTSAVIRGILYWEELTRVRTSVKFYNDDNGGPVVNGHNPWHDCKEFSQTGWEVTSCVHNYYSLSGPNLIQSKASGEFYNDTVLDDYETDSWAKTKAIGYEHGNDRFEAECGWSGHPSGTWTRCELWKKKL